ncbi:Ff.00g066580.m01.CDS01 [Fusarium sp. VM40]|nr:Ff.00g066580.m01.CDS01 [Fusarium sp. VM40]
MIPPSQQGPTQLESGNFFHRSGVDYSRNIDEAAKIQRISQDAHTLHKLAQSYDIGQFLNKPSIASTSSANDIDISAVVTLAANISQALDEIVRSVPRRQISEDGGTEHKATRRSRSPPSNNIRPVSPKQCHTCGVTETPRWRRSAPDSPLLCNFCSLVQSKRATRTRSGSMAASVFTRISHP